MFRRLPTIMGLLRLRFCGHQASSYYPVSSCTIRSCSSGTSSVSSSVSSPSQQDSSPLFIKEVSASNFDLHVLSSKLALAVTFYRPDDEISLAHVESMKGLAHAANDPSVASHKWFKLCSINADANQNIASTFSVKRDRLPATLFIYDQDIVDRFSGYIDSGTGESIIRKYREYYEDRSERSVAIGGSDTAAKLSSQRSTSSAEKGGGGGKSPTERMAEIIERLLGPSSLAEAAGEQQVGDLETSLETLTATTKFASAEVKAQVILLRALVVSSVDSHHQNSVARTREDPLNILTELDAPLRKAVRASSQLTRLQSVVIFQAMTRKLCGTNNKARAGDDDEATTTLQQCCHELIRGAVGENLKHDLLAYDTLSANPVFPAEDADKLLSAAKAAFLTAKREQREKKAKDVPLEERSSTVKLSSKLQHLRGGQSGVEISSASSGSLSAESSTEEVLSSVNYYLSLRMALQALPSCYEAQRSPEAKTFQARVANLPAAL